MAELARDACTSRNECEFVYGIMIEMLLVYAGFSSGSSCGCGVEWLNESR